MAFTPVDVSAGRKVPLASSSSGPFVVEEARRDAGIVEASFSAVEPERYVDCGTTTSIAPPYVAEGPLLRRTSYAPGTSRMAYSVRYRAGARPPGKPFQESGPWLVFFDSPCS